MIVGPMRLSMVFFYFYYIEKFKINCFERTMVMEVHVKSYLV